MIYLDNAATTRTDEAAVAAMLPFFTEDYGNPSGIYKFASKSRNAIDEARDVIAGTLACKSDEIYFTSGGTEANNWVLRAATEMNCKKRHIITTCVEHHSVLNTCKQLEREGRSITILCVDKEGYINTKALENSIRPDTALISVMYANNEIGTIQPISEIAKIAKKYNILFHTDAVQAYGHMPIDVSKEGIDILTASGHKFNGPKGSGFMYIRNGIKLKPLIYGGGQERHRRAGTENVAGIVGMAHAARTAHCEMKQRYDYVVQLRDYFINRILREIPYVRLNGPRQNRLANNTNFSFQSIEGEALLIMLDMKGICASGGSACTTGSIEPSHVLMAIGLTEELARGGVRMTLSHLTTKEELDITVECLKKAVAQLRR